MPITNEKLSLGPEQLRLLGIAFDKAWSEVAAQHGYDPAGQSPLKERLATVFMQLARDSALSPEDVHSHAISLLNGSPPSPN
jgi:hypothetical protein